MRLKEITRLFAVIFILTPMGCALNKRVELTPLSIPTPVSNNIPNILPDSLRNPNDIVPDSTYFQVDSVIKNGIGYSTDSSFVGNPTLPDPKQVEHRHPINHSTTLNNANLKYGILGYSYPLSMDVHDSKNIHAFISIKFSGSQVRDTIRTIILEDEDSNNIDSIVIKERIPLFEFVTIDLVSLDSSIQVTHNIHPSAKQLLDTITGNKWSWTILAKSADRPKSKLKLVIRTENPQYFKERTIPINIKVDTNILRRIYGFLIENPKILVVSILIPLFGFFGNRFFRKNENGPAPSDSI